LSNRAQRRAQARNKTVPLTTTTPQKRSGGVVVSYLHPVGDVNARFHTSLINLLVRDMPSKGGAGHIVEHGGHLALSSGANIVTGRNKMVRAFLNDFPTEPEWLWMLDSDMTFEPDTLDRLLAAADATERPIVGGLCFALMKGEAQEVQPTIYGMSQGQGTIRHLGYAKDQLVRVVGTGAACLLVHRSVFERIRALCWDDDFEARYVETYGQPSGKTSGEVLFPPPWPWFQETITGTEFGDSMSEDLTFCLRASQAGFPIYVDTRVKIGHVKPVVIDEDEFFLRLPAPEEPAPTFVVVPVKGQHAYTEGLLRQLSEQGGYDHLFVYDNADSDCYGGFVPESCTVIRSPGLSIYQMWNLGVKEALNRSQRSNIAILNNDLELGDEFLSLLAQGLRAHPSVAAVCGNYDRREFTEAVQAVKGVAAGREDGTGGLAGFAFMVRGEIFAAGCPLFDEQYEIWYGDTDFLQTLDAAGVTYGIVRDAHVVHIDGGSKTSGDGKGKRLTPELQAAADRDRERFVAKWNLT